MAGTGPGGGGARDRRVNLEKEAGLPRGSVRDDKAIDRHVIIAGLIFIFLGTVAAAFWFATTPHWNQAKQLLDLILPAETALLGTAVAFYMAN